MVIANERKTLYNADVDDKLNCGKKTSGCKMTTAEKAQYKDVDASSDYAWAPQSSLIFCLGLLLHASCVLSSPRAN